MIACTIVARNYLPYARVLARSFREHHPESRFVSLLVDDEQCVVSGDEPFEVLRPEDLGLDRHELHKMATIYDVTELSTALKPWLLGALLRQRVGPVLYLDPDVQVFDRLDDLGTLATGHRIVLVPHMRGPIPADGRMPLESQILQTGAYNLGCIAVGPGAEPFLDWWTDRLRRDCLRAVDQGLFVDQRWIDLVPGIFGGHVDVDPTVNVAYWNLHERTVSYEGSRFFVEGRPLRFFHFSGFECESPWMLSRYQGDSPRHLLSENPALAKLCSDYAELLMEHGHRRATAIPYGYGRTTHGIVLHRHLRRAYRLALIEAERSGAPAPPDPFESEGAREFVRWLQEPAGPGVHHEISRYLYALWTGKDLAPHFPDLFRPRSARSFVEWARAAVDDHPDIVAELLPDPLPKIPAPEGQGVNVAGYVYSESGVGQQARLLIDTLRRASVPVSVIPVMASGTRQEHRFPEEPAEPRYDINILCMNADAMPQLLDADGNDLRSGRYTIGYWAWEIGEFPEWMRASADLVDEIWANSSFAARAIAAGISKPVLAMPLPVATPRPEPATRADLGLPDGFLFMFCFDALSIVERKNPQAIVEAFMRAFAPGEGPRLVIKSVNAATAPFEMERLRAAAAGRPDVLIIDGYVSLERQHALINACDTYVSLHRAEGFGLTVAEAMALGKPVITTGYSGNLDFTSDANAYLVRHTLVEIPSGCDPYPRGELWAEPDLDGAAELMRAVYRDPEAARAKGEIAKRDIRRLHSPEARAGVILDRLDAIRQRENPTAEPEAQPSWTDVAREDIHGPLNVRTNSRFGPIAWGPRYLVARSLRHYDDRQRRIANALLNAVEELKDSSGPVADELQRLRGDIISAEERLLALEQRSSILALQLDAVGDEISAVPYVSDPWALRTTDPAGRETIGYARANGWASRDVSLLFDDLFRGSEHFVRERQRVYLDLLTPQAPVLDMGCGRGEMLDLLSGSGVAACGIDLDPVKVELCRRKGHAVEIADALNYLRASSPASFGAIFSAQVIEHLASEDVERFFSAALRALRPGGLLLAETVNPHSLRALKTFWLDPTHQKPIYPEAAVVLSARVGFEQAFVLFPHGTGKLATDRRTEGEYAVVARKRLDG